jgi:hypothetical protein
MCQVKPACVSVFAAVVGLMLFCAIPLIFYDLELRDWFWTYFQDLIAVLEISAIAGLIFFLFRQWKPKGGLASQILPAVLSTGFAVAAFSFLTGSYWTTLQLDLNCWRTKNAIYLEAKATRGPTNSLLVLDAFGAYFVGGQQQAQFAMGDVRRAAPFVDPEPEGPGQGAVRKFDGRWRVRLNPNDITTFAGSVETSVNRKSPIVAAFYLIGKSNLSIPIEQWTSTCVVRQGSPKG